MDKEEYFHDEFHYKSKTVNVLEIILRQQQNTAHLIVHLQFDTESITDIDVPSLQFWFGQ